jgi:hypothetical protein
VAGALEVLGGVPVLRRVAAADVAAFEAGAQVDPGVSEGDALLADVDLGGGVFGVGEVFAEHRHSLFPRRLQVEKMRLRRLVSGCSNAIKPDAGEIGAALATGAFRAL